MKSLLIQTFCLLFLCLGTVRAQQYQLASPNGKLSVTVDAGEALTWQIAHDGTTVLQPSAIALQGRDEKSAKKAITFGKNVKVIRAERKSVESSFPTPLYKKASVKDVYNQLTLKCRGGYSVQFRAYDDGAAYRFISEQNKPFIVLNETADFNFDKDYQAWFAWTEERKPLSWKPDWKTIPACSSLQIPRHVKECRQHLPPIRWKKQSADTTG